MPDNSVLHPENNGLCEICGKDLKTQPATVYEGDGVTAINIHRAGLPVVAMATIYHCSHCRHNTLYWDETPVSFVKEVLILIYTFLRGDKS